MAESVDALVSNTSGATRPGSTPGLGTRLRKQSLAGRCLQGMIVFLTYVKERFKFATKETAKLVHGHKCTYLCTVNQKN